jgi:exonuclease SbcC
MIIQTIELENFKSFGEPAQEADLTGVDVVSISGPNGAGKSTIVEALTFALYGRSTATERKELGNEAIIRDGQDDARVAVTFEKDGQTYQVERTAT